MLEINTDVINGIMFIHLEGELNNKTITQFDNELNYLLYKQGMHYFIFDFKEIDKIEANVFTWLDNKLVEIFLNCGRVAICGLDNYKNCFSKQDRLFLTGEECQAINYLTI